MAVAQRYEELNPGVRIHWEKRTLDEFGHKPIDQMIHDYDLIVIDHPWAGYCFDRNLVLDLKNLLSTSQWMELEHHCVGKSFESYYFENKLLAIPIDAAAPTPSWRPDLMTERSLQLPETWEDLIQLADQKQVIMPGFGADLFLNWMMVLHALNANPFTDPDRICDKDKGLEAMRMLKRLAEPMPEEMFGWNPIKVAELMTQNDDFAYCAFAYSYGNYCRPSYVRKPIKYGKHVLLDGIPLRSILGGTGLAISAGCPEVQLAIDFSMFCADARIQSTLYTYAGGQPVRQETWQDNELDAFAGGFFADSYRAHEDAVLRPRYNGYVAFQEKGGIPLQRFVKGEISMDQAWDTMNTQYQLSRESGT